MRNFLLQTHSSQDCFKKPGSRYVSPMMPFALSFSMDICSLRPLVYGGKDEGLDPPHDAPTPIQSTCPARRNLAQRRLCSELCLPHGPTNKSWSHPTIDIKADARLGAATRTSNGSGPTEAQRAQEVKRSDISPRHARNKPPRRTEKARGSLQSSVSQRSGSDGGQQKWRPFQTYPPHTSQNKLGSLTGREQNYNGSPSYRQCSKPLHQRNGKYCRNFTAWSTFGISLAYQESLSQLLSNQSLDTIEMNQGDFRNLHQALLLIAK